jgi:hypothetical protein
MDYLATKSWNWKGQIYPQSVAIPIQGGKPDGYKSSQASSVRFLQEIIKINPDANTQQKSN